MTEYNSEKNKYIILGIYFVLVCILMIYGTYRSTNRIRDFIRLFVAFIFYPFKVFVMLSLFILFWSLVKTIFYQIFKSTGELDQVAKSVLSWTWMVVILVYFMTGNKMVIGLLLLMICFSMSGYGLRKQFVEDDLFGYGLVNPFADDPYPRSPLVYVLLVICIFSSIAVFAFLKNEIARKVSGFLLMIFVIAFAILFMTDIKKETKKGTKSLIENRVKKTYMVPFELRQRKWYEWVWVAFLILLTMLIVIPIAYLCAYIYMFNPVQ